MLQAWPSIGYIVLLAIFVLAFILWCRGVPVLAIAALVLGIPSGSDGNMHVEHGQPASSQDGSAPQPSDPRGNTSDIEYIYMRNRSDRGSS